MSLLNLQSLRFFNKKTTLFLNFKKFRLTGHTIILLKVSGCIQSPSLGIRCIFYDFDLYKTQKTHENTREDSLHNISVILSAVWYAKTKFSRASFWDVFLNLRQISRKKCWEYIRGSQLQQKSSLGCFPKSLYRVLATN